MKRSVIFIMATLCFMADPGSGQNLTAREIMERNNAQATTRDERAGFTMKLINKRGKERKRKVVMYSKTDAQNKEKTLVRFLSPADVKGVGLLSIDDGDREDQWLYLPALKRVRRISSSEKSDSFMGSDFSYEDIEQNELNDYQYTLLGQETVDGVDCYVVRSIPASDEIKKETAYSMTDMWIRKDNYVSVMVKFYNQKGDLIKLMVSTDIRRIDGAEKWRANFITMKNVKTGHRTELLYDTIQINQGVADKFFTQRYLERGR
ncbi:MAG: outer membrane lipoprotein-sorting protein [FCB group bacterium]|nr:outer membrane lipoprotein-sorting protein [FCB group bacterium]